MALAPGFDGIYDRAAMIALPEETRAETPKLIEAGATFVHEHVYAIGFGTANAPIERTWRNPPETGRTISK